MQVQHNPIRGTPTYFIDQQPSMQVQSIPLRGTTNHFIGLPKDLQFITFQSIMIPTGIDLSKIKKLQIIINGCTIWNISFPLILKSLLQTSSNNLVKIPFVPTTPTLYHDSARNNVIK